MPRISDIYNYPPSTPGVPDTTIESADYNAYIDDIKDDLNFPRPILAGGTSASDAVNALINLGGEKSKQIVTNYDGVPTGQLAWLSGSFYSAAGASGAPTANAFIGFVSVQDANNMVFVACDLTDAVHPIYSRTKVGGAWSVWIKQATLADISTKADKTYVDAQDALKADKTYVDAADALKADKTYVDAADALKADKTYVDAADALKAPLASPVFTGNPAAPTPSPGDNDTSLATTAFVAAAVAAGGPAAATAAEYVANSAPTKMLTPGAVWLAVNQLQLTDAATVTPDFSLGIDFQWTIGATGRTLANPINAKPGQKGIIVLRQDVTGNRTITTWGSSYMFPGGVKPTLSTAGFAWDIVSYFVLSSSLIFCTFNADFK